MFWDSPYFVEFTAIAIAHLLAVISPGPDFAIVSRYSVRYGARTGVWVSLGVGLGILVHVTYSILGLSLVIHETPWLYKLLTVVAIGYFLWLSLNLLRSKPAEAGSSGDSANKSQVEILERRKAIWIGFLTNGLNVKATMFFLALFTTIISLDTPTQVKVGYGIYLAIATFVWFSSLSLMLGKTRLRQWLLEHGYWFDRTMGVLLLLLAINLFVQTWI